MPRLPKPSYMAFPFRIGAGGADVSNRGEHVREQIEQVLFTNPGERVFRPEFGAGLRRLVFEPNTAPLWELTNKRLLTALLEVLQGEVDPRTLEVAVEGRDEHTGQVDEKLRITVRYELTAIGHREEHKFKLGPEAGDG